MFTQLVHLTVVWSLNHWNRESYIFELEFEFEFELDFELDFELQKKIIVYLSSSGEERCVTSLKTEGDYWSASRY